MLEVTGTNPVSLAEVIMRNVSIRFLFLCFYNFIRSEHAILIFSVLQLLYNSVNKLGHQFVDLVDTIPGLLSYSRFKGQDRDQVRMWDLKTTNSEFKS